MRNLLLLLSSCILFFASCKKEFVQDEPVNALTNTSSVIIDTSKGWYGTLKDRMRDPETNVTDTLPEDEIISNGLANIPNLEGNITTAVNYDFPINLQVFADSSSFETILRSNPNSTKIYIVGNRQTASFSYEAQPADSFGYYRITVGNSAVELKVYPKDDYSIFKTIQFAFKNYTAYLFVNKKLITSLKYKRAEYIGNVKTLSVGYGDFVGCDRVRIHNSYTKNLRMLENFNIDGQSHTIFY